MANIEMREMPLEFADRCQIHRCIRQITTSPL